MKLLVFCPYYPPHIGGLESHADEFNKYLSQKGVDITVFTPRLPKDASETETRYRDVKIIRFPAFEIISNYPLPKFWSLRFWKMFGRLFENDFDIVISRTRFFSTSLLAIFYAKIKRKKWIHIEHGSDFVCLSSSFKTEMAKLYDYTFGRLIFRASDLNISISKAVQKFVYKFDRRESPIIYRGINFGEIEGIKSAEELKKRYEGKIIISFAGRLYKWKGVENSIKAFKFLSEEMRKKVVFLIIGNGEDQERLKKLAENEEGIVFLGGISREKTISILKISDIYLHSAYPGGGLSTSLLEALYCGCGVIATPNEGAEEIIEDNKNGFLIKESDSKLIVEKIKEMLNRNSEEQKIYAKNLVAEKFNWQKSIEKYLKIIK